MRNIIRVIIPLLGLLFVSCVSSTVLQTNSTLIDESETGRFDLILYGMQTLTDVESVAVLDRRDDTYEIEAVNGLHVKKVVQDLSAVEASKMATEFLVDSVVVSRVSTRNIMGPQGELVGYEIRPIFNEFQASNSFYSVWYYLDGPEKIKFRVEWLQFNDPFSRD